MIDQTAFFTLSYGLYLIGAKEGDRRYGCLVNTFQQITSEPPRVSVAIHKENATCQAIQRTGKFTASVLSEESTMELIGTFGFHSSYDRDKYAGVETLLDGSGHPYVSEQCVARFSVDVINQVDVGTHIVFLGDVTEAEMLEPGKPMTYAYYHEIRGGKTPPRASSYNGGVSAASAALKNSSSGGVASAGAKAVGGAEGAAAEAKATGSENAATAEGVETGGANANKPTYAWRCTVCGYIEYMDELPDDYVCPLCGVSKSMFERIEL